MTDCSSFLLPLRRPEVTLDAAFSNCVAVFLDHPIPSHLCRQCFDEAWEQRIIAAARVVHEGKVPDPGDYGQIYFEHPHCVGGEDTIKLLTPFGLRDLLAGRPPFGFSKFRYCDVVETMVQAGFWFWPEGQRAVVREIALCLFWEWFEAGRYHWPMPDYAAKDTLGPGEAILALCTLCLIDPFDMVRALSGLNTPQAAAALAGPINFSVSASTYVARDSSSGATRYYDATTKIAQSLKMREAVGFITFVTKTWVDDAYFRNAEHAPEVAKALSEFGKYYDIRMLKTYEAAQMLPLEVWPTLDLIGDGHEVGHYRSYH